MSSAEVQLLGQSLFALIELLEMYYDQGYEVSETLEDAKARLAKLDDKLLKQPPLSEYGE